jgi:hypothetical protein
MSSERRVFRPFDISEALARFLSEARLIVGGDTADAIDGFTRRGLDAADLAAGNFKLEIARDDERFAELMHTARLAEAEGFGEGNSELAVVVTAPYLKLMDVTVRKPLAEVERLIEVAPGTRPAGFRAFHHGCDVDAYLVLADEVEERPLTPFRKATWLSRVRFELRTGLEGVGFNILPLTDAEREAFHLSTQTLRYVALDESPLEASSSAVVNLYVDSDVLFRLKREPRKNWAKAFTDQLAVDVLTAITIRALADRSVHEMEWVDVEDTLLGALIGMVAGRPTGDDTEDERQRQTLLEQLRQNPHRFVSLIEGAVDMRDSAPLIVGSS